MTWRTPRNGGGGGGGDGGDELEGGFDDHDWDGAKELTKEEAKQLKQDVTKLRYPCR